MVCLRARERPDEGHMAKVLTEDEARRMGVGFSQADLLSLLVFLWHLAIGNASESDF
jgi:hypothetical protein